jgi:hypothetical protein
MARILSIFLVMLVSRNRPIHAIRDVSHLRPFETIVNDPRYDTTFKVLFGQDQERTASLLNSILSPRTANERISKLSFLESNRYSYHDRTVMLDVAIQCECETKSGHRYIVGMQKARVSGFTNRWVYYGSRELVHNGQIRNQNLKSAKKGKEEAVKNPLRRFYKNLVPVKTSGIVNRITGIGYLVRTGLEPVRTSTYQVQSGTEHV